MYQSNFGDSESFLGRSAKTCRLHDAYHSLVGMFIFIATIGTTVILTICVNGFRLLCSINDVRLYPSCYKLQIQWIQNGLRFVEIQRKSPGPVLSVVLSDVSLSH